MALFENTTDGLMFVPNVLEINTSTYPVSVSVRITNLGNLAHTWTIASQPNVTLLPSNFTQYFSKNPPLATPPIPGGAGSVAWANFTIGAQGVYQYICTIPGHFSLPSGMFGFLYVDVTPPIPAAPPSTAIIHVGILYASGSILAVGVVIAAMAGITGRFPPKKEPAHAE